MVRRLVGHPLFAPALALAAFAWGSAVVAFLLLGPGLAPWTDRLLVACFGWNAETRHYRLDALLIALLQPPLFVGVVGVVYGDELRAFLRSRGGRSVGLLAPAVFLSLAVYLVVTGEVSASGTPPSSAALAAPIRQGALAPAFALVDHHGRAVSRETFRGAPAVLTFVYANCHAICPTLIGRLKGLEAGGPDDAVFVAVTLDPERDTPAALAAYATRWGLGPHWRFVTGEPAAVRRLAAAYGVQWARRPDGEIAHENVIVLVDRAGRVAFTYRGLAHPEARIVADLARLAKERG
jgi:protein SCO1/2